MYVDQMKNYITRGKNKKFKQMYLVYVSPGNEMVGIKFFRIYNSIQFSKDQNACNFVFQKLYAEFCNIDIATSTFGLVNFICCTTNVFSPAIFARNKL